jgi:hypothetical protein
MTQIPGLYMRRDGAARRQPGPRGARRGFGDATSDLAAFHSTVAAGDLYLKASEYDNAVQAYQAAGQTGATTVGPEIDTYTNGASKTKTQQAWTINGQLAALASTGNTQTTATQAQSFATQMGNLYDQAISIVPTLPPPPTPTGGGPTPTGSPLPTGTNTPGPLATTQGTNYTVPILVGASVVGLGIVGWAVYSRRGGRRGFMENPAHEARLTYKQRSRLPDSAFALPEKRTNGKGGLPLTNKSGRLDPKHVRNAASRLAQMRKRGTVTPSQYKRARRKIIRAACKTGVEKTCRVYLD